MVSPMSQLEALASAAAYMASQEDMTWARLRTLAAVAADAEYLPVLSSRRPGDDDQSTAHSAPLTPFLSASTGTPANAPLNEDGDYAIPPWTVSPVPVNPAFTHDATSITPSISPPPLLDPPYLAHVQFNGCEHLMDPYELLPPLLVDTCVELRQVKSSRWISYTINALAVELHDEQTLWRFIDGIHCRHGFADIRAFPAFQ